MKLTIFKKNQIIIIVIALMLISAGYLNYTYSPEDVIKTSSRADENFGDATLVSSNNIVEEQLSANIVENENKTDEKSQTEGNENQRDTDYFTLAKLERDNLYSSQLENYQKIIDNSNSTTEQKNEASNSIKKINEVKNKIMIAENLIKLKDFSEVIILVNDESINVVVKAENLDTSQVAQLQNIVTREFGAKMENIHISKK